MALHERRLLRGIVGLVPHRHPVPAVVRVVPLIRHLSGGKHSPPDSPALASPPPSHAKTPPAHISTGSSPSHDGFPHSNSPPSIGGRSPQPSRGGSPHSKSPPSTGGGSSPSHGGPHSNSPPSTGGDSSPSTGGSPPSTGGHSPPSTDGGSPPSDSNGGGSPSPGSSKPPSDNGGGGPSLSPLVTTPSPPSSPPIRNNPLAGSPSSDPVVGSIPDRTSPMNLPSSDSANSTSDIFSSNSPPPVVKFTSTSLSGTIQSSASSITNSPSSSNGPNGTGINSNNPVSSDLASPHHHLSTGTIAAIIILLLFFLGVLPIVVFILRRRSRYQRAERRTKWWFGITRSSQPYEDAPDDQLIPHTARSSFVTTIDRSDELAYPTQHVPPLIPAPTAETGRGNATRPAALVINILDRNQNESRFSIASAGSDRSQYVVVQSPNYRDSGNPDQPGTTPMSVRPFSPSESFAFPKPPGSAAASGSVGSRSESGFTSTAPIPTRSITSTTTTISPSLPTFMSIMVPSTIKSPSLPPVPPVILADNSNDNPFDDPSTPISPHAHPQM